MQPPPRSIKPAVWADVYIHTRTIDRLQLLWYGNTRPHHCHSKGVYTCASQALLCKSTVHNSCIPVSCLGTRDTHEPSPLSAQCRFGCHSSQINTDTSFMCQRRYRVCAPCLRGGTIYCQEIGYPLGATCIEKNRELNFRGLRPICEKCKNLALYGMLPQP